MPVADFTVATPTAGAAGSAMLQEGMNQQDAALARSTAATNTTRINDVNSQRTLPQLQGSIAAAGQWYSGARQNAEVFNAQDVDYSKLGVTSALQRQLNDLDRQRMYAATGLIV